MTFACPRFMIFSTEMIQAAKDDAEANGWGTAENPPFIYGVVGHDVDEVLDPGQTSTCCQCYQLVFEKPEPASPQPPELPIPKPMIVQSFNTQAGGGKAFDIFMGAGGYGAFNACYEGAGAGFPRSTFGHFMYKNYPLFKQPFQGGIKFLGVSECQANPGQTTMTSVQANTCQDTIKQQCNQIEAQTDGVTHSTRQSCMLANHINHLYHQNWDVRVKKVACPESLTRVTGCRLNDQNLPPPDPQVQTVAQADSSWKQGYHTTTMQDCCKPSCAWKDWVGKKDLSVDGKWDSFYSCDVNGNPISQP
jgi:hypothetical protein